MIYTEEENLRWWNGLPKSKQGELLESIAEKAHTGRVRQWAEATIELWERGSPLNLKDLASIRKWDF